LSSGRAVELAALGELDGCTGWNSCVVRSEAGNSAERRTMGSVLLLALDANDPLIDVRDDRGLSLRSVCDRVPARVSVIATGVEFRLLLVVLLLLLPSSLD
jgi:hypothetical protein